MVKHSYGLVPYRTGPSGLEVLIGHLGGPFWARKHERAWSFPKGLAEPDETPIQTARREFNEELGIVAPTTGFTELGAVTQAGGKTVTAWAVEVDVNVDDLSPGTFDLEWPPKSGRIQQFEEIDVIRWVNPDEARALLIAAQTIFVDRLEQTVSA